MEELIQCGWKVKESDSKNAGEVRQHELLGAKVPASKILGVYAHAIPYSNAT